MSLWVGGVGLPDDEKDVWRTELFPLLLCGNLDDFLSVGIWIAKHSSNLIAPGSRSVTRPRGFHLFSRANPRPLPENLSRMLREVADAGPEQDTFHWLEVQWNCDILRQAGWQGATSWLNSSQQETERWYEQVGLQTMLF